MVVFNEICNLNFTILFTDKICNQEPQIIKEKQIIKKQMNNEIVIIEKL